MAAGLRGSSHIPLAAGLLLVGGIFALTIVAQWSAGLFLHPCQ